MMRFLFCFFSGLLMSVCFGVEPNEGFVSDVNLGLTLNRGNTENSLLNASFETRNKSDSDDFSASLVYNYGETTREDDDGKFTSTDNAEAKAQYNRLFSERAYGLVSFSAYRDELSSVKYRILSGPGLGYHLVRNEIWRLSVEGGLSYLLEEKSDERDEYTVFRFAQMYERDVSENASVWQDLEILPRADALSNYLLNFEIGARAKLNGRLSLRVVLTQRYDSEAAEENEKSDWSLVSGISYRL